MYSAWHIANCSFVVFVATALCPTLSHAATGTTQVVVFEGQLAPDGNGLLSDLDFLFNNNPILNDKGQLAFHSSLSNTSGGDSDNQGIFLWDSGKTTQIIRKGQVSPDGNGSFSDLFLTGLNKAGQIGFKASLNNTQDGDNDNEGLFAWDGTTTPIIRKGQSPPDGNGVIWNFPASKLNNANQTLFFSELRDSDDDFTGDEGIFRNDGGNSLVEIARRGQNATDGNGIFSFLEIPALNEAGQAAFTASLSDTIGGSTDNFGIYRGDGEAAPVQIAREGQTVPDGNGQFLRFESPDLNNAGQATFRASITGGTSPDGIYFNDGIYMGNGATDLIEIIRTGYTAPDGNGTIAGLGLPTIDEAGQAAFLASLTGTSGGDNDDKGVYLGDGTNVLLQIARTGQSAPHSTDIFVDFGLFAHLNDQGQIVFRASLADTPNGDSVRSGIFFYDERFGLLPVVRQGDALLGSTLTSFSIPRTTQKNDSFNNLGQVAYFFELADDRQGFAIWSVPEPSTAAILSLFSASFIYRRRSD